MADQKIQPTFRAVIGRIRKLRQLRGMISPRPWGCWLLQERPSILHVDTKVVEKGQGSGGDGREVEADDVTGSYGFDVEKQTISIINILFGGGSG